MKGEPMITCTINGQQMPLMIDTGAAVSCLTGLKGSAPMSGKTMRTVGFSGQLQEQRFTQPLMTQVGTQCLHHEFLDSPSCPVNLMGRDLLAKLGASILCTADGLRVRFTDNTQTPLLTHGDRILYMAPDVEPAQKTTVYWARVLEKDHVGESVREQYEIWKKWIQQQGDYEDPMDPLHVTYNYTREWDENYDEAWLKEKEGEKEQMAIQDIFLAAEGVAASIALTQTQHKWYNTEEDEIYPHVTLAIGRTHQARQLGPMVKRAMAVKEWIPTKCKTLHRDTTGTLWHISHRSIENAINERQVLERDHTSDILNHPKTDGMLSTLPSHLWTTSDYDVGYVGHHEVSVELKPDQGPVWLPQYRTKPEAALGIKPTIEGLLKAGVLVTTNSPWNTPILPVPKEAGLKWRLVHDLRIINQATIKDSRLVPNPYVALNGIKSTHRWFSVVDLANALFCLPLKPECQDKIYLYQTASRFPELPEHFSSLSKARLGGPAHTRRCEHATICGRHSD